MYRGVGRVVAELAPEGADVHVERLGRAEPGRVPHLADQLLTLYDAPRVLEEHPQELVLLHRQLERLAVPDDRVAVEVHPHVADREHGTVGLAPRARRRAAGPRAPARRARPR